MEFIKGDSLKSKLLNTALILLLTFGLEGTLLSCAVLALACVVVFLIGRKRGAGEQA